MNEKENGQGLVEFALVIPILLVLLVGVFEFGFFFFVYGSVNNASREAVRYGAGAGDSENGVPYYQDCAGIRATAIRTGLFAGLDESMIEIDYDEGPDAPVNWDGSYEACPGEPELGSRIMVRVTATYEPIVGFLNFPPIPIVAESARTIIKDVVVGSP